MRCLGLRVVSSSTSFWGFSQHSRWHQGFINLIRNPTCAAQQNRLCTLSERWKASADFSPQFRHVEKLFLQRAVGVGEEDIFQAPYRQCRFSAPFSLSFFGLLSNLRDSLFKAVWFPCWRGDHGNHHRAPGGHTGMLTGRSMCPGRSFGLT